jgi:hypothetical protein
MDLSTLKRIFMQHQLTTFYKLGEASLGYNRRLSKGIVNKL